MEETLQQTLKTLQEAYRRIPEREDSSAEISDLDSQIEQYEQKINDLKKKISDQNNYKRIKSKFENDERPIIEELLKESLSVQKEELENNIKAYTKLQNEQIKRLNDYREETQRLNLEIKKIQQRLYRNSVAQSRGYKKLELTTEEVSSLQAELKHKQDLIELGKETMQICSDEIKVQGQLITECNKNIAVIEEKEERLSKIENYKIENPKSDIDAYRLRLDQDELSSLEAGLAAMKERKHFLEIDPKKMIKEQIEGITQQLENLKQRQIESEEKYNKSNDSQNNAKSETDLVPTNQQGTGFVMVPPVENDNNNDNLKTDSNPLGQIDDDKTKSGNEHKVVKITPAKDFLKKHKKAILIAGGLAAVALLAQPVIIPAIMHANSVLWFHSPTAIQGFLHNCNLVLGKVIGASYNIGSGIWTSAAGTAMNATAAKASLLGALATPALGFGAVGVAAKKMIDKIKNRKKNNTNTDEKIEVVESIDGDFKESEKNETLDGEVISAEEAQQRMKSEYLQQLKEERVKLTNSDNDEILDIGGTTL